MVLMVVRFDLVMGEVGIAVGGFAPKHGTLAGISLTC